MESLATEDSKEAAMPIAPFTDWGEAIRTSLAGALALLLAGVPRIIGFLLILLIGWFISGLLARAVASLLRVIRFNDLANRAGITGFVQQMGIRRDASGVMADIVMWFVRLVTLIVAFDALGLPAVSQVLQQFLLWIPNLVVALVILVLTGLAANALARVVRGATAEAGFTNPVLLANIARIAVWSFGIIIAVNQIGIAQTLVNTLFFGLVGALALALGLAFGLGGRDTAGEMVRSWYQQGQQAAPKMERAVNEAGQQTQQGDDQQTIRRLLSQEPGTSGD
jgi:hypothetical protein